MGTDAKAIQNAWNAISAKHPHLAAMLISVDQEASKVGEEEVAPC